MWKISVSYMRSDPFSDKERVAWNFWLRSLLQLDVTRRLRRTMRACSFAQQVSL